MSPLRYVHSWQTVAFTGVVLSFLLAIFKWAPPESQSALVGVLCAIGTVIAGALRQSFAVPPPAAPKRIEVPRRDGDDDGPGAGGEVLAEDGPPTRPHRTSSARNTLLSVPTGLALALVFGCSPSALQSHATVAVVASVTMQTIAPVVTAGCAAVLDGCHADDACLERAHRDCRTAGAAYESALATTRLYMDSVDLATRAEEASVLPALASMLSSLTSRWDEYRAALAMVGVSLPPLPPIAVELVSRLQ